MPPRPPWAIPTISRPSLVTVGKRAALWLQDLLLDLEELDFVLGSLRFSGLPGHHRHRGQLHGPL